MRKSVSSSSDMITAAASSGLNPGRVWSRSIPPCSPSLFPSISTLATCTGDADRPMHEGPGASGPAGAPLGPHRLSSVLGQAGPLGTSGLPRNEHC